MYLFIFYWKAKWWGMFKVLSFSNHEYNIFTSTILLITIELEKSVFEIIFLGIGPFHSRVLISRLEFMTKMVMSQCENEPIKVFWNLLHSLLYLYLICFQTDSNLWVLLETSPFSGKLATPEFFSNRFWWAK